MFGYVLGLALVGLCSVVFWLLKNDGAASIKDQSGLFRMRHYDK